MGRKKKVVANVSNPLELIEQGIITNDMQMVAEGYKGLTGKVVQIGKEGKVKPANKKVVTPNEQSTTRVEKDSFRPVPNEPATSEFINGGFVRATRNNLFKDEGGVVSIGGEVIGTFAEDKKIDSLIKKSKGDRRGPSTDIKMVCGRCRKETIVSAKQAMLYANPNNPDDVRPTFTCC